MRASGAASGVSASALRFAPVAAPWGALPATGAGPPANDFQSVTGFVICGFHRASRLFPGSSAVEQPAVNRLVAGSNPARGANKIKDLCQRLEVNSSVRYSIGTQRFLRSPSRAQIALGDE
jgi:hypothetical protein